MWRNLSKTPICVPQNLFKSVFAFILFFQFASFAPASAQCRDPWVTQAIKQVYGRNPVGSGETCECSIKLYNNGSWNNYNELVGYVQQLRNSGLRFGYIPAGSNTGVVVEQNGRLAISLVNSAGQVVAAGGANVVAPGGANLSNPAKVIAPGGGNFSSLSANSPGWNYGSDRQVLSSGQSRINTSGRGSLILGR